MFEGRRPSRRYRLRQHRANSVVLTPAELVEIRAAQRTFEGAYVRTALGQFSFALIVLKIFTGEFYSIGALFAVYGSGIMLVSWLRRRKGNRQIFWETGIPGGSRPGGQMGFIGEEEVPGMTGGQKFRTSGNVVTVLTALSLAAYVGLLVLTINLRS
ncbi:hypothetical protein P152DRAFT_475808 [Eremomyces bilateralis CBS 781.70]|uniref:DUF202 domain-containing protein n=1 Tax=Eremomyces bilateralis CBS 781.70 TaxID=1392243 RepID=A0A6G1FX12_9PEZI|nr:uncharacterized protein P152DRAFT_475808 [Eremomyces bilateralis CBS 781.70]KAF1810242.1 hypothetical protein P152DRAFT_475808 [Eremomyces bilateralis CBS 781.70]